MHACHLFLNKSINIKKNKKSQQREHESGTKSIHWRTTLDKFTKQERKKPLTIRQTHRDVFRVNTKWFKPENKAKTSIINEPKEN